MKRRRVRFLIASRPYNRGEAAGFSEEVAADLVERRGIAVYDPPSEEGPAGDKNEKAPEFPPEGRERAYGSPKDRMQRRGVRKGAAA